jgi:bifunctional DNA-binding transcriptional regulator/antitoxin component of YhaV-PrlF toxin-antitoxin module
MQKTSKMMNHVLLPIPYEVAEELGLDPFTTIQFTISRGRLIIEPIDAEQSTICIGNCRRCPGRECCEDAFR